MRFIAHYVAKDKPDYYRTIHADDISDAMWQAERFTRKSYICKSVTQQLGKE